MDQVGRVLDAVEDNGLSESTVIMFVGDHGYQMGEHSEWLKNNNFEISHRAPMLLHVPGVIDQVGGDLYPHLHPHPHAVPAQATVEDSLVEFVDILPTLVEAAGLPDLELCPEYSRNVSICR